MAGFLTDLVNNRVLDCLFGGEAMVSLPTLYFGLSRTKASKGGFISEPSGGSYARVAVSNDLTHFSTAFAGTKSNATAIRFPPPSSDWGSILSVFVSDSLDGGNVLAMADLGSCMSIQRGDSIPTIAVNALFLSHL